MMTASTMRECLRIQDRTADNAGTIASARPSRPFVLTLTQCTNRGCMGRRELDAGCRRPTVVPYTLNRNSTTSPHIPTSAARHELDAAQDGETLPGRSANQPDYMLNI
ncbi:hypothetical protein GCM10009591_33910 [Brachybacterium tyrofermentans]